jgi:hypothetical protein
MLPGMNVCPLVNLSCPPKPLYVSRMRRPPALKACVTLIPGGDDTLTSMNVARRFPIPRRAAHITLVPRSPLAFPCRYHFAVSGLGTCSPGGGIKG